MSSQEILEAIAAAKQRVLRVKDEISTPSNRPDAPSVNKQEVLADAQRINALNEFDEWFLDGSTSFPIAKEHTTSIVYLSTLPKVMKQNKEGYVVPIKSLVVVDVPPPSRNSPIEIFIDYYSDLGELKTLKPLMMEYAVKEMLIKVVYAKTNFILTNEMFDELPSLSINLYNKETAGVETNAYSSTGIYHYGESTNLAYVVNGYRGQQYGSYNASLKAEQISSSELNTIPELTVEPFKIKSGFPHVSRDEIYYDVRVSEGQHVVQKNYTKYPGEQKIVKEILLTDLKLPLNLKSKYPAILLGRDKVMFDKEYKPRTGINFKQLKEKPSTDKPVYVKAGSCLFVTPTSIAYRDIDSNILFEINNPIGADLDVKTIDAHFGHTIVYYKDATGKTVIHLCDLNEKDGKVVNTSLIQSQVNSLDGYYLDSETILLACTDSGLEQYVITREGLLVSCDLFMSGPLANLSPDFALFTKTAEKQGSLGVLVFYTNSQATTDVDIAYASLDIKVDSLTFNNLITNSLTYGLTGFNDLDNIGVIDESKVSISKTSVNVRILVSGDRKEVVVKIPNTKLESNLDWNSRVIAQSWGLTSPKNFSVRGVNYILGLNADELTLSVSDQWAFNDPNATARFPLIDSFAVGYYGSDALIVARSKTGQVMYLTLDSSFYKEAYEGIELNLTPLTGFVDPDFQEI